MGEKPDDIAKEIADLRRETNIIVDELRHRANLPYVAKGVAGRMTREAQMVAGDVSRRAELFAGEVTEVLPEPVRQHQPLFGGAALGMLAGLGLYAIAHIVEERERPLPEVLGERVRSSATIAGSSAKQSATQLSASLRGAVQQAQTARSTQGQSAREDNRMMVKRLLWVGMVSVMGALGAMLFQRLTASFWRKTMHERPPEE